MIKKVRCLAAFMLAAVFVLSAAGCTKYRTTVKTTVIEEQEQPAEEQQPVEQPTAVKMEYATGMDEEGKEYDTTLFGKNGYSDQESWDPCIIYVSKEEDPKYGGYFYMYPTGDGRRSYGATMTDEYFNNLGVKDYTNAVYRSTDMYNWEKCGVLPGGFTVEVDLEDWQDRTHQAPECIRSPHDGKYYMYWNCDVAADYGVDSLCQSGNGLDRMYISVAVSDTPVGPFDILYDIDPATGKRVPTINFQVGCNTTYSDWGVIDVDAFFDDNGDFYLYFKKESGTHAGGILGIFGGKMKSMAYIDYSTVSAITMPDVYTCSNKPGHINPIDIEKGDMYWFQEGINEGGYMIKHNGKYYMTYAANGYSSPSYSVHQAVSDNPLSGFRKLSAEEGNPVLDGSIFGNMVGTAHHSFVKVGDEYFICYHRHNSKNDGSSTGRSVCVDRVNWVTNDDGLEILTSNGPSYNLTWLPEAVSGCANLARTADIKISAGTGAEYLNDNILPYYTLTANRIMSVPNGTEDKTVEIKLTWNKPVSVRAVMVYNSINIDTAFSKIAETRFKLAEKPSWADKEYDYALIENLSYPNVLYDADSEEYVQLGPAVAEFSPIKVTEITFVIKSEDRVIPFTRMGEENNGLDLSEIVVLGGK